MMPKQKRNVPKPSTDEAIFKDNYMKVLNEKFKLARQLHALENRLEEQLAKNERFRMVIEEGAPDSDIIIAAKPVTKEQSNFFVSSKARGPRSSKPIIIPQGDTDSIGGRSISEVSDIVSIKPKDSATLWREKRNESLARAKEALEKTELPPEKNDIPPHLQNLIGEDISRKNAPKDSIDTLSVQSTRYDKKTEADDWFKRMTGQPTTEPEPSMTEQEISTKVTDPVPWTDIPFKYVSEETILVQPMAPVAPVKERVVVEPVQKPVHKQVHIPTSNYQQLEQELRRLQNCYEMINLYSLIIIFILLTVFIMKEVKLVLFGSTGLTQEQYSVSSCTKDPTCASSEISTKVANTAPLQVYSGQPETVTCTTLLEKTDFPTKYDPSRSLYIELQLKYDNENDRFNCEVCNRNVKQIEAV